MKNYKRATYRVDVKQTGEKEHGKQKATAGGDQERIQGSNGVIIEMNNKDIECNETVKRKKKKDNSDYDQHFQRIC